jgi:putative acetyltransferase
MSVTITEDHPLTPDLALLFQRHTADMHADTPPESIHMMDASELAIPQVQFFVARDGGQPLAMGAFKQLSDPTHAEIKSMHVLVEARGRGCPRPCWSIFWPWPRRTGFSG